MERKRDIWYEHRRTEDWISEYPECSIFAQLKNNAEKYPSLPAVKFQNKSYSFKELIEIIEQLAAALHVSGLKKGDIISIVSPNTPQAVFMFYAINRIGAVANMIHPLLSVNEIQHFVESTESSAVFVLDAVYDKISAIKWNTEKNPKIIIARVIDALPVWMKPLYALKNKKKPNLNSSHDNIYWNDLLKLADNNNATLPPDSGKADDLAVILYTGGTTGMQKGAMFNNYSFTCYSIQTLEASGLELKGKRCLAVLPLFHGFGLAFNVHAMLAGGTCIYLVPVYDFNKCNALIFKEKLNFLYGVPAFFESLSRYPKMENSDLSFMEALVSGGDVLSERLQTRINKQLKAGGAEFPIRNAYGQTESLTGCCINPIFKNVIGSVGLPCPDMEAKIVEPGTCKEVPDGTDGELCLTGPILTLGYYKDEEATRQILKKHDDGKIWLHTGDIFCKNDDEFLFFRQRLKRMIISAGYNIYLSHVEEVVSDCDIVKQCCAVGTDDKVAGQYVGLYVILNNETEESNARDIIINHCKDNLAEYSVPRKIVFADSFPKTKMGKVDFRLLEDKINNR